MVGDPLEGHTDSVSSVAYSPNGCRIISGSHDRTIRTWEAVAGTEAGKPPRGHTHHIVSGSCDDDTHVWGASPYASIRPSSCKPIHPDFLARPHMDGWVRDSEGGLLYWVPHECRSSAHSSALVTIPLTSRNRSVSLDFDDIAIGASWPLIFESAPSLH